MMKRLWMLGAVLICSGAAQAGFFDRTPPEGYLDPIDQEIARTGKGAADRPRPCERVERSQGAPVIRELPTDQCVKMLPARRYRGLWLDQFELSRFCPEPARECTSSSPGDKIWIDRAQFPNPRGTLHVVDFIGRRTMYKAGYGHLGVSDHEMIVDRVLLIQPVKDSGPDGE